MDRSKARGLSYPGQENEEEGGGFQGLAKGKFRRVNVSPGEIRLRQKDRFRQAEVVELFALSDLVHGELDLAGGMGWKTDDLLH